MKFAICILQINFDVRDENDQMDQHPIFWIFVLCKVLF